MSAHCLVNFIVYGATTLLSHSPWHSLSLCLGVVFPPRAWFTGDLPQPGYWLASETERGLSHPVMSVRVPHSRKLLGEDVCSLGLF